MDNIALIESFGDFKDEKNIDRITLMAILEESLQSVLRKKFGSDDNFDIIVNPDKGDLEIWHNRIVVEDGMSEDDSAEIELSEARKIEPDFEVGEEVSEEIALKDLGRRAILALRQNLVAKVMEHDNANLYERFKDIEGEIVSGEVHHIRQKHIIVMDDEQNEMILPRENQIPSDFFRKGESVRAVVDEVKLKGIKPQIILSRTSPKFLEKLFETEIPEIFDGIITIKGVVRIPGEKAKVAVESYDDRIDPVGACVGMKGFRIHGIVRELRNENIDVINYTNNTNLFIQRALSPAKINSISVKEEERRAEVFLYPDEVSLAIGKGGANIKLASMLTGYNIEVFREIDDFDEEDIYLDEFRDEIDGWVIDQLKRIGCSTAKNVLAMPRERLIKEADLEENTVDEVLKILRYEFEDEDTTDEEPEI